MQAVNQSTDSDTTTVHHVSQYKCAYTYNTHVVTMLDCAQLWVWLSVLLTTRLWLYEWAFLCVCLFWLSFSRPFCLHIYIFIIWEWQGGGCALTRSEIGSDKLHECSGVLFTRLPNQVTYYQQSCWFYASLLLLPYSVQLQHSEDSDTFTLSACWVTLVFPESIWL